MSQETPQTIKLTIKDTPALPPRPPVSVPSPAAVPVSGDAAKAPAGVKDPLSLRDTNTSRLKRIKVDSLGQAGATVMVTSPTAGGRDKRDSTETVRLKIIKEKRQGAAPTAAANQTIRLRPPPPKVAGFRRRRLFRPPSLPFRPPPRPCAWMPPPPR